MEESPNFLNNQPSQSVPQAIPPHGKNPSTKFLIVAVIIMIVGGALYGYYSFLALQNYNAVIREAEKASQQIKSDPTSDWKTYRNEEYGFEFKYPATLYVLEGENYGKVVIRKESERSSPTVFAYISVDIEKNPNGLSPMVWWQNNIKNLEQYADPVNFSIARFPAIGSEELTGYGIRYTYLFKNDDVYSFEVIGIDEYDQILSTFRFIE